MNPTFGLGTEAAKTWPQEQSRNIDMWKVDHPDPVSHYPCSPSSSSGEATEKELRSRPSERTKKRGERGGKSTGPRRDKSKGGVSQQREESIGDHTKEHFPRGPPVESTSIPCRGDTRGRCELLWAASEIQGGLPRELSREVLGRQEGERGQDGQPAKHLLRALRRRRKAADGGRHGGGPQVWSAEEWSCRVGRQG